VKTGDERDKDFYAFLNIVDVFTCRYAVDKVKPGAAVDRRLTSGL